MEKVKLPREVADALVRTKSAHYTWNNHDLCYIVLNELGYCQYENEPDIKTLHKWSNTNELNFAKALMNGYEVEQTPEEKVREAFEDNMRYAENPDAPYEEKLMYKKTAEGIRHAINLLNIKIPGVNE